jgi:hypothetical protein
MPIGVNHANTLTTRRRRTQPSIPAPFVQETTRGCDLPPAVRAPPPDEARAPTFGALKGPGAGPIGAYDRLRRGPGLRFLCVCAHIGTVTNRVPRASKPRNVENPQPCARRAVSRILLARAVLDLHGVRVVALREFRHSGGGGQLDGVRGWSIEPARLLNAHDPSSWPLPVKLVGVGNRIWRLNASRGPVIGVAWRVCVLPVAGVLWAIGLTWNRALRRRDRAHASRA